MPDDKALEKKEEHMNKLAVVDDPVIKNLIEVYDDDYINSLKLTDAKLKELIKYASKVRYGSFTFVPQICTGHECCYNKTCPLIDQPPLGHYCPFEKLMADNLRKQYYKSLDVNENDITERSQIDEIVESDIVNSRTNAILGKESFIMRNTIAVDQDTGEEIKRKEEHIAMRVKQRAQERRDKIFKNFIATRKDKLNSLDKMAEDPTEYFARLRSKVKKIKKAMENIGPDNVEGKDVIEAKYRNDAKETEKEQTEKTEVKEKPKTSQEEAPW